MQPYHRWRIFVATVLLAPPRFPAGARADVVWRTLPTRCLRADDRSDAIWCRAQPPRTIVEVRAVHQALERMRALGGICASLARTIDALHRRGRLRLYDAGEFAGIGAMAPRSGVDPWILVSRDFIVRHPDAKHASGNIDSNGIPRPETLQLILAHEADHIFGLDHIDRDGYLTPNALRCSDISA